MQIFLQGKLLGIEDFLLAPAGGERDHAFTGRSHWVSLLGEILPRALLAELGLAKILLGSSGGGQFLLVLPEESRAAADTFLDAAAKEIASLSDGVVKLIWSVTENLGDWSDVRRRLNEQMTRLRGTPWSEESSTPSEPRRRRLLRRPTRLETARRRNRGLVSRNARTHSSRRRQARVGPNRIPRLAPLRPPRRAQRRRHRTSLDRNALASRAAGLGTWGVLRGDVDNFDIRIRRAQTIEEHIQLSVMYKQFFAGELEVLCSMPEFWRKVTVIYSGGDDFAVYGAWDALIGLAREMERLFRRFAETNLTDFAGPEGKTITMALAPSPAEDASLGSVFEEAGRRLEAAKSSDKDCIYLLGRTLEWKQFTDAADLKDLLLRMVTDFGVSAQYLKDLCGIYRETQSKMSKRQARKMGGERPWRYHRRIRRILSAARPAMGPGRGDYQKARTALIADLIGRSAVTVKLRPAGRVALEWARLSAEA